MNTGDNDKIRPEKLLLQTYASYLQQLYRRSKVCWRKIPAKVKRWSALILGLSLIHI